MSTATKGREPRQPRPNTEVVPAVHNPFGVGKAEPATQAVARTDQQRAIAEVQAAMLIARANPRDPKAAMDRIMNACARPTLAEKATYDYARGGSEITGPSIRLAEVMAQCWGNLQYGIRELEQANGESTVQAFCWDVETNTRKEVTYQVPHKRFTKSGSYALTDPRDIYEMVANSGARRLRACILAIIPGDVQDVAVEQCEATLRTKIDCSSAAVQRMLAAFEKLGVLKEQIEARIQRRIEAILPAQLLQLKKIHTSMSDGMSQVGDWFPTAQAAPASTGGVDDLATSLGIDQSQAGATREPGEDDDPALFGGDGKGGAE